jgi:hypothetical protein
VRSSEIVPATADNGSMPRFLFAVRYVLPAAVVVIGLGLFMLDPTVEGAEGPAAFIGAGLSVWLLNVLHRVGVAGDADRRAEDAARAYFDSHGRWPDEAPR